MTNHLPSHNQLPAQITAAEIEPTAKFKAAFSDAMHRTPPELERYIGERTIGNPGLFERVLVECDGSEELAGWLIDYDHRMSQLDDPAYDQNAVRAELDDISRHVVDFRGTHTDPS